MPDPKMLNLSSASISLLEKLSIHHRQQRLGQALLLLNSYPLQDDGLAQQLAGLLLCQNHERQPCHTCRSCHLLAINEHPDLIFIKPEQSKQAIKIDQIRTLQLSVYTSPQLSNCRIIVINPAEKMNNAASNALLKLLEEPPENVYFILMAAHLSTISATILSRCQLWRMTSEEIKDYTLFSLATAMLNDPELEKVLKSLPQLINDLEALINEQSSACVIAAKWTSYEVNALFSVLYLLHAQLINQTLTPTIKSPVQSLANHLTPVKLFIQLDKISATIKKLNQSVHVNQLLALENLLLGYMN